MILFNALPRCALYNRLQAKTARQGAELLGRLVSQHGAGEALGVLFADAREAWCAGLHGARWRVDAGFVFVQKG